MTKSGQTIFKPALAEEIFSKDDFVNKYAFKNKTAVITGCNRGIGKKILEVFSNNSAKIFACVRNNDTQFKDYCKKLSEKNNSEIYPVTLDLGSSETIDEAAKSILKSSDNIDILINNAGIIQNSLFQMTKGSDLKKIFEINFFSLKNFTQKIIKGMVKNKKGSIVYISSTSKLIITLEEMHIHQLKQLQFLNHKHYQENWADTILE